MIVSVNNLLLPLEKNIKKYSISIRYILLLLSSVSIGFLFVQNGIKESGEKAILVLWVILWIPIFARVLDLGVAKALMPLRKEMGILMGMLVIIHSLWFIISEPTYLLTRDFWITDRSPSAYAFGFMWYMFTLPLFFTSNKWSIKKLGRYWKALHRLAYGIIILVVIHVVLIKYFRGFEIWPVIILWLYFIGKILEWKGVCLKKKWIMKVYPKWQKWLCPPCGYIYDPLMGDSDSGIIPGTEFSDIPDNWECPECGVKKSDFIPYWEWAQEQSYSASIKEKTLLNDSTMELVIESEKSLKSHPGQYIWFLWEDEKWIFQRQYSIVEHRGKLFTFTIKLTPEWRGAKLLREIPISSKIRIIGVFGNFLLMKTQKPKIFIATGTGLAPIYHMIQALSPDIKKSLYFSVATEAELFYRKKLESISDLDLHIHVTREKVEWCEEGRVDIDTIKANSETEWYLCGNPRMLSEAVEKIKKRWFTKIYTEKFS